MEQPPEEAPEVREEEEKKEVARAEGAPELNGGPGHSLPSSSYTGKGEQAGDMGQRGHRWGLGDREPGPLLTASSWGAGQQGG